jgi:hypothetical protein
MANHNTSSDMKRTASEENRKMHHALYQNRRHSPEKLDVKGCLLRKPFDSTELIFEEMPR